MGDEKEEESELKRESDVRLGTSSVALDATSGAIDKIVKGVKKVFKRDKDEG